jgi:hypothetical protein
MCQRQTHDDNTVDDLERRLAFSTHCDDVDVPARAPSCLSLALHPRLTDRVRTVHEHAETPVHDIVRG